MPLQKILLKAIALPVFIFFVAALVYIKSVPAGQPIPNIPQLPVYANTVGASHVDTSENGKTDTIRPVRQFLPSSKSGRIVDQDMFSTLPSLVPRFLIKRKKQPATVRTDSLPATLPKNYLPIQPQ